MNDLYWSLLCVFCFYVGYNTGKHFEEYWVLAKRLGNVYADKAFDKVYGHAFDKDTPKITEEVKP